MSSANQMYQEIVAQFLNEDGVQEGKMMRAPALQYKGKVFAFFHEGAMTFRLGKDFKPEDQQIMDYRFLSPFKHKPPMKAWFIIGEEYSGIWSVLTEMALVFIQKTVK